MSRIEFSPSTSLCIGNEKAPGHLRVLACRRQDTGPGKELEVSALLLDEKKGKLCVWRERKGITALRGAGKYAMRVIDVAHDGLFVAVFFHHDKGRRLGLGVLQLSPCNAARLSVGPVDYSECLDAALAPLVSGERKGKEETSQLHVHNSCLKQTRSGLVMAVILSTPEGTLHMVISALEANVWKCFRLENSFATPACLCIQSERAVSLMSSTVGPPVDYTIAAVAPTVELALSVFDQARRVDDDNDDGEKRISHSSGNTNSTPPQKAGALCCVLLHESIFSLDDYDAVINVCYQSQRFRVSEVDNGMHAASHSRLYADGEHQRYTAVVTLGTWNYMVNLQRSPLNMELVAHCKKVGIQGIPRGVAWLSRPHPSQPEGGVQIVVLLSQDYRLYAAEVFGDTLCVQVVDSHGDYADMVQFNSSLTITSSGVAPASRKGLMDGKSALTSSAGFMHLVRVSEDEILCFNGVLGTVLRVTDLSFDGSNPRELLIRNPSILEDGENPVRRVTSLMHCLHHIEKLLSSDKPKLPQIVFQWVLPMLQCSRPSQHEVFLTQRVFQALLKVAAPQSAAEWRVMWSLTMVLQKMLSKRCRDSTVVYTDVFFIQLIGKDLCLRGAVNADGEDQAAEVISSLVSDELKRTWQSFEKQADDNASFVLDCLAERVPLISLAEESVRRMVVVSTLSNGTHVVSARANTCHIVHTVATTMLASCLGVSVYVDTDDAGWVTCYAAQSGNTAVFVPPHPLNDGAEFDCVLTLSTDLFCVMAPENRPMPCAAALLSMLVARRYHVVSTFLQVFALPLADLLTSLEPLCNNVHLLAGCSAAVSLTESALFRNILSDLTPSAILHVLCNGSMLEDYFNMGLWRYIGGILSSDTRALILAAVLHAMTDRLIAAQNNYSTSLVKALLRGDSQHPIKEEVSVLACRKRLGIVLGRLEHLWACVDVWSPYKVADIVSSVLRSNTAAQSVEGTDVPALMSGSAVSRIFVVCFRILSLVGYTHHTEDHIEELMLNATSDTSTIRAAFALIQAIGHLKGTALPVESLQWRCVDLAASSADICQRTPGLAGFLLEMLKLSEASQTIITPLKQYYYTVVDILTEVTQADVANARTLHELELQLRELNRAVTSATSMLGSETRYFLWSKRAGTSGLALPDWPGDHNLATRRYLINMEWVDVMWPIEFVAHLLETCLNHELERILRCDTADGSARAEPSPHFSQALFHHLCTLSPPVRTHAVLASPNATAAVAGRQPAQRSPKSADGTGTRAMLLPTSSPPPPPRSKSEMKELSSSVVVPEHEKVNDDFLTTDSTSSSSSVRGVHIETQPTTPFSGNPVSIAAATAVAAAAAASSQFPPNSVAWWETGDDLDNAAKRERAIMETLQGIDIEFTSSATSYTTATSENHVRRLNVDPRSAHAMMNFSPRRCKRHSRQHYRCAKHRLRGGDAEEWDYSMKLSRPERLDKEPHSARMTSSVSPKGKSSAGVRLLQFQNVLQPPPLPLKMADEVPMHLVRPQDPHEANDLTPPQLISLRGKPQVPRVRLFACGGASEGADVQNRVAATGSNLGFLTGPSSPLQSLALAPPPLPPSCVFVDPPPLLKLKASTALGDTIPRGTSRPPAVEKGLLQHEDHRIAENEELVAPTATYTSVFASARTASADVVPNVIAPLSMQQPTVASVDAPSKPPFVPRAMPPPPPPQEQQQQQQQPRLQPEHQQPHYPLPSTSFRSEIHGGLIPGNLAAASLPLQGRREDEEEEEKKKKVVVVDSPKPEATFIPIVAQPVVSPTRQAAPLVSQMREPILSPSENAAFQKYVGELKEAAHAVALPPQVPRVVQPPLIGVQADVPARFVTTQSVESHEQHRELLAVVKETLAQHEEHHAKQIRSVMEAIRLGTERTSSPLERGNNPPMGLQAAGLSPLQQAELLRHTIQQKDRLMVMNQDLLELHGRVQNFVSTPPREEVTQPAIPGVAPGVVDKHQMMLKPVPLTAPLRLDVATSAGTGEVGVMSSCVQAGKGMKEMEDASTMAVGGIGDSGTRVVPDIHSTMSLDRTLSNLQRIDAELLRFNATADDMERAIRDSRSILNKHTSLGSAYTASIEGSLMMDAARRRTAALEQQLTRLNANSSSGPWMGAVGQGAVVIAGEERDQPFVPPSEKKREVPPPQRSYVSPTAENYSGEDVVSEAAVTAALPSSRFCFTSESVEVNEDTALPVAPPFAGHKGADHVFESHTDEAFQQDTPPIGAAAAAERSNRLHSPAVRPNTMETAARTRSVSPTSAGNEAALPQRCVKGKTSPTAEVMDLGQLYALARNASGSHSLKKSAAFSVSQTKRLSSAVSSPRAAQAVPERFAMYLPAARSKKVQRGASGRGAGFHSVAAAEPQKSLMTTDTTKMGRAGSMLTMAAPNRGGAKARFSSRDSKRRDTMALHTAERLAEFQRTFL